MHCELVEKFNNTNSFFSREELVRRGCVTSMLFFCGTSEPDPVCGYKADVPLPARAAVSLWTSSATQTLDQRRAEHKSHPIFILHPVHRFSTKT